jgi:hypothetical protein
MKDVAFTVILLSELCATISPDAVWLGGASDCRGEFAALVNGFSDHLYTLTRDYKQLQRHRSSPEFTNHHSSR